MNETINAEISAVNQIKFGDALCGSALKERRLQDLLTYSFGI